MSVIALVGNKGGAGKTTLAVNLACALSRDAATVVLDADPQGSVLQWRAIAEDGDAPPVLAAFANLDEIAARHRARHEHVVIDCPPSVHAPQTHAALRLSDIVLIPVQPSPMDLWATVHIERAVQDARRHNPELAARLVINQLEPRTRLSRLMHEALAELDLPVAVTAIHRRVIYRTSVLEGKSVQQMGRRGSAASDEIQQLIHEVIPS